MKLITFTNKDDDKKQVAVLDGTKVFPINRLLPQISDMNALIEAGDDALCRIRAALSSGHGEYLPLNAVTVCAPIPRPKQDIICLGINYMAHAEEAARFENEAFGGERPAPIYFSKRTNEATAPDGVILSHSDITDSLDYEAELAVIIGRDAKNVSPQDAEDYIFGYTIINDVSARNIQTRHKQWYFGKSLDTFTPMGPCIVTADEIAFPPDLAIESRINGELRQSSRTSFLIFGIAHVISELSAGMTLEAGTIISMGTPSGVGMGFDPPRFLKPGDTVECSIEGIGVLKNTVM